MKKKYGLWLIIALVIVLIESFILITQRARISDLIYTLRKPPIVADVKTVEDQIGAWKEYKDDEAGFSIKHPDNWIVDKNNIRGASFMTPSENLAYEKEKSEGGPGGPTQIGCEVLRIGTYDSTQYKRDIASRRKFGVFTFFQNTPLNKMHAKYFTDPTICEHDIWAITKGNKTYEIALMTPNDLFYSVVPIEEYDAALIIISTFKINE